ncbi:MAG TPA: type II toxin-antitoxin system VapC family toxin [Pseudorhizobium sp.]|nr:type II toxin-antitoxin system VapC family toxin [Pseudorhizobium sp.]
MASRSATQSTRRGARHPSAAKAAKAAAPTFRYVETSALLAALLEQDAAARSALRGRRRITSALTFTEASRALVRARVAGRLTPADERAGLRWLQRFRRRCDVVAVTDAVLARAGRPFPVEPIRTLDAVHLATAELLGEPPQLITVVTRDSRVIDNARALGYAVE